MPVTIPANQVDFQDLLHRATSGKERFIVEEEGKPVVAIIPMKEYDDLVKDREEHERDKQARLKAFEQATRAIGKAVAKSGLSEDELMAKVEETRQRLFEEHYGTKPTSE